MIGSCKVAVQCCDWLPWDGRVFFHGKFTVFLCLSCLFCYSFVVIFYAQKVRTLCAASDEIRFVRFSLQFYS